MSEQNERQNSINEQNEIPLPEIDAQLAQLKIFETDQVNEEVVRSREAMRRVLDPHLEWFNERKVVVTYHGSLQYHDPRNLDADIVFISQDVDYNNPEMRTRITDFETAFRQPGAWPRQPTDTNFNVVTISGIQRDLGRLEENARYDSGNDENPPAALEASFILSSALLYPDQQPQMANYQTQTRRLIRDNEWLREGVLENLEYTVNERQVRRSPPANP